MSDSRILSLTVKETHFLSVQPVVALGSMRPGQTQKEESGKVVGIASTVPSALLFPFMSNGCMLGMHTKACALSINCRIFHNRVAIILVSDSLPKNHKQVSSVQTILPLTDQRPLP